MSSSIAKLSAYPLEPVADSHRWFLASIMLVTIAFGWKWPILGFIVPVAMGAGIGGAFFRGRYVCGNICPRGSFYDTFFRTVGGSRPVPAFLSRMRFRWVVMAILMSLMALQISQNPGDPMHWGLVFWLVCLVTTIVGVALGLYYRPRTWCSFCPVGTMANAIGGDNDQLTIASNCRGCGTCERSCPMDFSIAGHRSAGVLPHRDCLKCSSCVKSCRNGALSFGT